MILVAVLFALKILKLLRTVGDRADDPGAEDPLACGLSSDPEDNDASVGLSSESRVLIAVITFETLAQAG